MQRAPLDRTASLLDGSKVHSLSMKASWEHLYVWRIWKAAKMRMQIVRLLSWLTDRFGVKVVIYELRVWLFISRGHVWVQSSVKKLGKQERIVLKCTSTNGQLPKEHHEVTSAAFIAYSNPILSHAERWWFRTTFHVAAEVRGGLLRQLLGSRICTLFNRKSISSFGVVHGLIVTPRPT